jgi:AraC-like DNA-binding protein
MQHTKADNHLQDAQQELVRLLDILLPADGAIQIDRDVHVFRLSHPTDLVHGESSLACCIIAQGSKRLLLGDDVFEYDNEHYLITAMELPTVSHVIEATPSRPYLSVKLDLDPALVRSVLVASAVELPAVDDATAFNVSHIDTDLLDAFMRLIHTLTNEGSSSYLVPLIKQEIVYRLLRGKQGARLSHIAGVGSASQRITPALRTLRERFDQPLSIPEIAQASGMSVSSFHDHFKRATGLTPLQFQKHLRLREARRLLMNDDIDVASAGYRVGYSDASHFNREYKRMFGEPPLRDLHRLRSGDRLTTQAD